MGRVSARAPLAALAVALISVAGCGRLDHEADREHCGAGTACAELPADRQCIEQGGASVCGLAYQYVMRITATGLEPNSSLVVTSHGHSIDWAVGSDGTLAGDQADYPPAGGEPVVFDLSGHAGNSSVVRGTITLDARSSDAAVPQRRERDIGRHVGDTGTGTSPVGTTSKPL